MRNALCESLVRHAGDPRFVFLTGDLGYQALEPLRDAAGPRFINAGVAEQNMLSMAAGLARGGLIPWTYSIAPFIYARPFEQIRNDVCMHDLPVKLVGNGGGYGYGVMGGTHHALEDYGALLCLPNLHAFVPAFAPDVPAIIDRLQSFAHPAYLRLGRCELPPRFSLPEYAAWRRLAQGQGPVIAVVGPIAGTILAALQEIDVRFRPTIWVISELPILSEDIPDGFFADLKRSGHLVVVEEHIVHGGVGQALAHCLLARGQTQYRFTHRAALGYPSATYGSQKFHRAECGLDPLSIRAMLEEL